MADEQNLDTQAFEANAAEAAGDDLVARVHALEEQLAAAQDQALRVSADMQNVRRRAEQDVEKAHKFALEKFANDLLPVVDSLERGIELTSADDEAINRRSSSPTKLGRPSHSYPSEPSHLDCKLFGEPVDPRIVVATKPSDCTYGNFACQSAQLLLLIAPRKVHLCVSIQPLIAGLEKIFTAARLVLACVIGCVIARVETTDQERQRPRGARWSCGSNMNTLSEFFLAKNPTFRGIFYIARGVGVIAV